MVVLFSLSNNYSILVLYTTNIHGKSKDWIFHFLSFLHWNKALSLHANGGFSSNDGRNEGVAHPFDHFTLLLVEVEKEREREREKNQDRVFDGNSAFSPVDRNKQREKISSRYVN